MSPTVPLEAPGGATQLGSSTARLPSPRVASGSTMRCHHHAPSKTRAPCTKTTFIPSTSPPTLAFLRLSWSHYILPAKQHIFRVEPRGFEPLTSAVQRR